MTEIIPTVGRLVHYCITRYDADRINERRKDAADKQFWHLAIRSGAHVHVGNTAAEGDIYPMLIIRVWGNTPNSAVNGQAFLDGNDSLWVTSVSVGEGPGKYSWMPYQTGQAAKTEELEKQLQETK